MRLWLLSLAIVCLYLVDAASAVPPPLRQCPGLSSLDTPPKGFSAAVHPVVLVHGWDGGPSRMMAIGAALQARGLSVKPFYFDYHTHDTDWAAQPTVAGCLAAYISAISAGYKGAGGDGKVIVVAHSMGGLATRFATSSQYVHTPIGQDLAGVITIDTPSLGSPFGNQALSRAIQALPIIGPRHPTSLFQAKPGTDASICLAAHQPPGNALPHGCALAPYLPPGIPITQLAGDMMVRRTIFGIPLYTLDLQTDGPVPVQSSHGYSNSGPGGQAPLGTDATSQPTISCTVNFDDVTATAAGAGIAGLGGVIGSLTSTVFVDNAATTQLQSGTSGPALDSFLVAAYALAPCSHSGMLTDPTSLADIATAVSDDITRLSTSAGSAKGSGSSGGGQPTSPPASAGTSYAAHNVQLSEGGFTFTGNVNLTIGAASTNTDNQQPPYVNVTAQLSGDASLINSTASYTAQSNEVPLLGVFAAYPKGSPICQGLGVPSFHPGPQDLCAVDVAEFAATCGDAMASLGSGQTVSLVPYAQFALNGLDPLGPQSCTGATATAQPPETFQLTHGMTAASAQPVISQLSAGPEYWVLVNEGSLAQSHEDPAAGGGPACQSTEEFYVQGGLFVGQVISSQPSGVTGCIGK